jgi:hypothetical protein
VGAKPLRWLLRNLGLLLTERPGKRRRLCELSSRGAVDLQGQLRTLKDTTSYWLFHALGARLGRHSRLI